MILKHSQLMVPVKVQRSQMQLNLEQQVLIRHPSQTQRVVSLVVLAKKPHLCDVIEQSNQQIKQMQEIIQSNSITSDPLSKKREEDREFVRQMMLTMSQTMMRVTQMLMQGAASGYHPPNHAYTPPNYSFHQVEWAMALTLHQQDHQAQLQAKHLQIMITRERLEN